MKVFFTILALSCVSLILLGGYGYINRIDDSLVKKIDNPPIQNIEITNKNIIEKSLDNKESAVFNNKDISNLSTKETDIDLADVIDMPYDISVNEFMLEFIPHKELELYNVNTKESLEAVFWIAGDYVPEALDELDQFMRDWRRNQIIDIDPDLYKLLYNLHENVEADAPIHLISGHRSEKTNTALRAQGRNTAKKSQHVLGKAADITIPGVPVSELRNEALEMEKGGVGYYPKNNFVHVDTGRVRQWTEK